MNKIKKKKDNSIIPVIETKRMKQRTTHYSPVTRGHSSAFVLLVRFNSMQFNSTDGQRDVQSDCPCKKKTVLYQKTHQTDEFLYCDELFFFFFLARLSRVQKKKTHSHDKILPSFFFSKTTDEQKNRRRTQKSHQRADELEGPTFALLQSIYTSIYKPILR